MTLKHTPATPLPFRVGDAGHSLFAPDAPRLICGGTSKRQDITYIAHAANAYPQLVEALRDLRRDETLDDDDARLVNTRAKVDALLRSLGEL